MGVAGKPTRKSLPLSEHDLRDLDALRRSSPHRDALADVMGEELTESSSESAFIHTVWEAGIRAVRERIEDQPYAAAAAAQDQNSRRAIARRRRPSWANET